MRFLEGAIEHEFEFEAVVVAGFTGRHQAEIQAHLDELAAEGIAVPQTVPSFYLVPPTSLLQTDSLVMTHAQTSGEAEIALIVHGDDLFVTLASDHTDRAAEAFDIAVSKRACPKVIASTVWRYEEVLPCWDTMRLRSWITDGQHRIKYQEGVAGELLAPADLLAKIAFRRRPHTFVILTGTIPALGGIRGSNHFWAELHEPSAGLSILLNYTVRVIDDILAG